MCRGSAAHMQLSAVRRPTVEVPHLSGIAVAGRRGASVAGMVALHLIERWAPLHPTDDRGAVSPPEQRRAA